MGTERTEGADFDRLVSAGTVAEALGVARNTVTRWGRTFLKGKGGGLRCVLLPSGRLKFRMSDVEAMLAATRDGGGSERMAISEGVPG